MRLTEMQKKESVAEYASSEGGILRISSCPTDE